MKFDAQSIFGAVGPIIHDGLIFVATTWVLMKNSYIEANVKISFKIVVLGRHLPDQITLARWAILFSVIITRITRDADTVFLGPLLSSMLFTRYCTLSISRFSHPAPDFRSNQHCHVMFIATCGLQCSETSQ